MNMFLRTQSVTNTECQTLCDLIGEVKTNAKTLRQLEIITDIVKESNETCLSQIEMMKNTI